MSNLIQADYNPDHQEISAPVLLKVPIVLQSQVTAKPYGCEVVVPILLRIPIALQIELLTKAPQCKKTENTSKIDIARSSQEPASESTSSKHPSDSLLIFDSSSTSDTDLATPINIKSETISIDKNGAKANIQLNRSIPLIENQLNTQSNLQNSSVQPKERSSHRPSHKLRRLYPVTVLTLLLGTLLGTSCSSMIVKHLSELATDQGCSIESAATQLASQEQCIGSIFLQH